MQSKSQHHNLAPVAASAGGRAGVVGGASRSLGWKRWFVSLARGRLLRLACWLRLSLAACVLPCLVLASCAELESSGDNRGELVVALQTDMAVPKDIDAIHLEVRVDGEQTHDEDLELYPDGEAKLPQTLVVQSGAKLEPPVDVIVVGLLRNTPRVFAQVRTVIPADQTSLLHIPLQWLCDGSAVQRSDGTYTTTCPGGDWVCRAGRCVDPELPAVELGEYVPQAVYGGGEDADDPEARCFATEECFDRGVVVSPDDECVVRLELRPSQALNLGLLLPSTVQDGICGELGCYVPLDNSELLGWYSLSETEEGGTADAGVARTVQAQLPMAVCDKLSSGEIAGVVATRSCETKTAAFPTCGPWCEIGVSAMLPPLSPDASLTLDAGAEPEADTPAPEPAEPDTEREAGAEVVLDAGAISIVSLDDVDHLAPNEVIRLTIPGVDPGDVQWSSSDPQIATVDENGVVATVAPGTVVITAQLNGQETTFEITVSRAEADSGTELVFVIEREAVTLSVSPASNSVPVGVSVGLNAVASFADGTVGNVNRLTTWSSADDSVASVSPEGVVTGLQVGATEITAAYGEATAVAHVEVNDAALVSLVIMPATIRLPAGVARQLQAMASFSDGRTLNVSRDADWATANAEIAAVSETGSLRGVAPGQTQVAVSFGDLEATAPVEVSDAELVSVTVTSPERVLAVGLSTRLRATAAFTDGVTLDVTDQVTWSTDRGNVLGVSETGRVTAFAEGTAVVTALMEDGNSGSLDLVVTSAVLEAFSVTPSAVALPLGQTLQFAALGSYSDGTSVNVTEDVTWSSDDVTVLTVDETGVASALAEGQAVVTVTLDAFSATIPVEVNSAALVSLSIDPAAIALPKGIIQQLHVMGSFTDGTSADVTSQVNWNSSDVEIVTVDNTGLATAVAEGAAVVSASIGQLSATAAFDVTSAELERIAVTPGSVSRALGLTARLTALGSYSDGTTRDLSAIVTWSSADLNVATVDSAGVMTAIGVGSTSVGAALDGWAGTAEVTVTDAVVRAVTLAPANTTLPSGKARQLTATASYSDGTTVDVTDQVQWSSAPTTVIAVQGAGLARAGLVLGAATVTAEFDGVVGSAQFTVTDAVVEVVTITPTTVSLAEGRDMGLSVSAAYSDGSSALVTDQATWRSGDPLIATVQGASVRAVSVGTTTAYAVVDGVEGSAPITVTNAVLDRITVVPDTVTLPDGHSTTLIANGSYSDGSTVDITGAVNWSSNDTDVVIVSVATTADGPVAQASAVGPGGPVLVSAMLSGVLGTSSITVNDAIVEVVTVTPTTSSVAAGRPVALTATATLSNGELLDVTNDATWRSSDISVASVLDNGRVSSLLPGSATITAQVADVAGSAALTVTDAVVDGITLTPANVSLALGFSAALEATIFYSDGTSEVDNQLENLNWSSADNNVVTVSNGQVTPVASGGPVAVTASIGTFSDSSQVTVTPAVPTALRLEAASTTLIDGRTRQITAIATMSSGPDTDVTGRVTNWVSDATQSLQVSGTGLVTGVDATPAGDPATVTATLGALTATLDFTVNPAVVDQLTISPASVELPAGQQQQMLVEAVWSDDPTPEDVTDAVVWTVGTPGVVSVTSTGLVTGTTAYASTALTAAFGGQTATAQFNVSDALVESIYLTGGDSVVAGETLQLQAWAEMSYGEDQPLGSGVVWSSDGDPDGVAPVTQTGLVSGQTPGTAQIMATFTQGSNSFATSLSLEVIPALLEGLIVSPTTGAAGTQQQLTVTPVYSDGNGTNVVASTLWSVADESIVTIADNSGLATVVGEGATTVTATYDDGTTSVSETFTFNGTAAIINALRISPSPISLALGQTQELTVTAELSQGPAQDVTDAVSWQSSDAAVADVVMGLLTTESPGNTTITARLDGVSANVQVTVSTAVIRSIVFDSDVASVRAGSALDLRDSLTVRMSDDSVGALSSAARWSSGDARVATVSGGVVNGLAPPSTTISVSEGLGSDSITVNVLAPTITVSPLSATLDVDETQQFSATATWSDGGEPSPVSPTWSSSDPSNVPIDANGVVTALGVTDSPATITASYLGGVALGTASVSVQSSTALSVSVSGSPSLLEFGTTSLTATATYSSGPPQDITSMASWVSDNEAVAGVSAGVVTGNGAGTARIRASFDGITSQPVTITVSGLVGIALSGTRLTAVGGGAELKAAGDWADGTRLDVTTHADLTWSADAPLTVKDGVISGVPASGEYAVRATMGVLTATAIVGSFPFIEVSPSSMTLPPGGTDQFSVVLHEQAGVSPAASGEAGTTYSGFDTGVIRVDGEGRVSALEAGTTQVTIANGQAPPVTVTVNVLGVASIAITPDNFALVAGDSASLDVTAIFTNQSSSVIDPNDVDWSLEQSGRSVSLSPDGVLSVAGTAQDEKVTVSASFGGRTDSIVVTIDARAVEAMVIDGGDTTIEAGASLGLSITVTYADGSKVGQINAESWSSDDPEKTVTVDADGVIRVSANAARGTYKITANYGGLSSSITVTVP